MSTEPTEHFNFMLPPNAWNKRPYRSTFQMTIKEAAERYPGAEPILSSKTVRTGTVEVFAASEARYGQGSPPK
ncbi:MAG: hypothetical protein EON56_03665 [Alphaproteobacteria bacterium]|nr:MAG: hypothetical protein EON56_03665 [Alphaproteobacteria bacterium]